MVYAPKMNATHCSLYITYIAGVYCVRIVGTEIGTIPGDVNLDRKVNVLDLIYVATHLGDNSTDGGR